MAADRHLLFGLLALQTGLIQQAQLVAAFHAWTTDKSRPLADHLMALGHLNAAQRSAVEALAALHVQAHGDDAAASLAAVPVDKSTRESLAVVGDPDIEATLGHVGSGHGSTEDGRADADRTASYAVGTATSVGQRFRILRPHARGGLGAVFVALDEELHREVALKQILDQHADDPTSRQRFVLEAEITGGLEHPGIAPVYGLGTYPDGRPYYAMRFIRGDSLKEAADRFHADESFKTDPGRRSLELRKLLRRFTDVCNAIGYAHSRGVLHRDIKPGNIIVGTYGETLVVDWGLAKAVGRIDPGVDSGERTLIPSSASGSAETLPGSALGTPSYMSPEQAEGDLEHLGTRSDIYSLGGTLYYLLTGRPPVEGDVYEVIRAAQRGEFPPPRRHDPTIDTALEAVCLKAMAHRPPDRYASARALAEDLERWMADEPVSAYREPLARRARRWARQNRTAVTTLAASVLVALAGTAAVLAVQTQANAALTAANADLYAANARAAAANAELTRSKAAVQARYDLAVEAIQAFHTGVSEDFLLKQEQFKELRDRLLKSAADFYGKLGALLGRETDLASRRALAASNFELAELTRKVGRTADALAAHRAVLAAREALAAEPGADAAAKAGVGRSLDAVARLLEFTGETDEALTAHRQAESLLAGPAGTDPEARAALAACRARLGYLLGEMGDLNAARAAHEAALADRRALAAARPDHIPAAVELASSLDVFGHFEEKTGRTAEALASFQEGRAVMERAVAAEPGVASHRDLLAHLMLHVGSLLSMTGQPAGAEAELRRALALYQKLADENPAVTSFRSRLAASHTNLGWLLLRRGRRQEAEAEHRRALALYQKLAEANPAVTDFRNGLADSHHNLGTLLWQTGDPSGAVPELRRALALYRKLAEENPAVISFRSSLARSHSNLGELLSESGRPQEAEAEYRTTIALQRELAEANPAVTDFRSGLADGHNVLGWLLMQAGRLQEAEAEYRTALALDRKLAGDNPEVPRYRDRAANLENNLSVVLRRLGRPAEARDHAERAIALRETLVEQDPRTTDYRGGLAENYLNRGLARRALGDPAGAVADLRRALGLYDGIPSRSGEQSFLFACSHASLAGLADRAGSGVSAAEASSEADAAMSQLHQTVGAGYRNPDAYRTEDALDPLRDRDDFRLLMMDLAMPAEPFARAR